MTAVPAFRGAVPVGHLSELGALEAGAVCAFRLWFDSEETRETFQQDMAMLLGRAAGRRASQSMHDLCSLCVNYGRRPLMRHGLDCACVGADEACFANLIAAAAEGSREDAMLLASLIVRPDMAPAMARLGEEVGLALKRALIAQPTMFTPTHPSNDLTH